MPDPTTRNWNLPGSDGEPILGTAHLPAGEARGVLLICHGFKGYKDYGFLPALADAAARGGLVAHRFNFSHSGMTERLETFERPELFERDTWGRQMHDLRAVAEAVADHTLAGGGLPAVWFGHSRGGVTVLLTARRIFADHETTGLRPAGLITAATPHEACRMSPGDRATLLREGRLASPSSRTGQTLYVGRAWLEEAEAQPAAFDPVRAAAAAVCPLLILHGTGDTTVEPASARRLAEAADTRATLALIEGASHTFDASNPLPPGAELPPATAELIRRSVGFAADCCAPR